MALNVLKNKAGEILNPRIPRYENSGKFSISEEIKTGQKWVDDKDIYRKVFTFKNPQFSNNKYYINHNISDFDVPIKLYGFCKPAPTTFWFPLPYPTTSDVDIMLYISSTQIGIEQKAYANNILETFYIVAEYTKK